MLLVTGGAGFIGSNVVAALNDTGRADLAVCDLLGHDGKWRNLAKRQLADIVPPAELFGWLQGRRLDAVEQRLAILEELVRSATSGVPYKVILAVPEIESWFFAPSTYPYEQVPIAF